MKITAEKIIYEKGEYIRKFPKTGAEVPGYYLLETESNYFKYGVNISPILISRDKSLEKGNVSFIWKKETRLPLNSFSTPTDEKIVKSQKQIETIEQSLKVRELKKKLRTLSTKIFYAKLIELYERIKIFESNTHYVEDSSYENFYEDENGNTLYIPPCGYGFNYKVKNPIRLIEVASNAFTESCITASLVNNEPVLCEKGYGEHNYTRVGIPLEPKDMELIKKFRQ